jgi:probable F420-dependent oxidoreductase
MDPKLSRVAEKGPPTGPDRRPDRYLGRMELGSVGVWWSGSWRVEPESTRHPASELESLGYGAIWSTGGFNPGLSARFDRLLASTKRIAIASGIVNIWKASPKELVPAVAELQARHPDRFLLGLGASHAQLIEGFSRPYTHMVEYLDLLDAADTSVGPDRRVLAALGPKMLELAARRAVGAHPYLVPVEHTARAREVMGKGPLLAPEVTVVLDTKARVARALARRFMTGYLTMPNYTNNLRSLGFGDEDLRDEASNRLVDAVVAWGNPDVVAERVRQHHQAGADHVCIQVVTQDDAFPLEQYRELAGALLPA